MTACPSTQVGRTSYPNYRDANTPWLGRTPGYWELCPLKAVLIRNDGGVWGEDFDNSGVIVLRSTEQTVDGGWDIREPARRRLTLAEIKSGRLEQGDLVVTKSSGSDAHIGKTSLVDESVARMCCCFSNFMQRLRLKKGHSPRFFWYLINSGSVREQLIFLASTTTGLGNLNGSVISSVRVAVPPELEQYAVARFLDRETAKIDALVAKKERLIELLQEKRTALITRAVTKGLDPTAPMKHSGMEWLGETPAHWQVRRLKYVSPSLGVGVVVNPSQYVTDEGVPFLYGSDILEDGISLRSARRMTEATSRSLPMSMLREGDLVMVRVGAPGVTAIVPAELHGSNCASMLIIRRGPLFESQWLHYVLNSRTVRAQVESVQYGAAQEQFNVGHAVDFVVPLPDLDEQAGIARALDERVQKIAALIERIRRAIESLREFRGALISAAVTGKIDVRHGLPPA